MVGVLCSALHSALVALLSTVSFLQDWQLAPVTWALPALGTLIWLLCTHSLLLNQLWFVSLLIYLFLLEWSFFALGIMKIYLFLCGDSGRVCIPEFLLWTRGLIFCSVCVSISPCSPSLWVSATHLWVLAFSIRCPFLGYQPFEAADSLIGVYFPGGVSTISLKVTLVGDLTGWHVLSFSYHSHI